MIDQRECKYYLLIIFSHLVHYQVNLTILGDSELPEEYTDIIKATNPTQDNLGTLQGGSGNSLGTFLKVSPKRHFDQDRNGMTFDPSANMAFPIGSRLAIRCNPCPPIHWRFD